MRRHLSSPRVQPPPAAMNNNPTDYECVFMSNWPFDDKCYQCGKTQAEHNMGLPIIEAQTRNAEHYERLAKLAPWNSKTRQSWLELARCARNCAEAYR